MKIIFEYKPKEKFWVIWPLCILFLETSEAPNYRDLTFAWLKIALSFRFNKRRRG